MFSGTEQAVYLVGGHRASGEPTGEVWRYDLRSDVWDPLFVAKLTETIPADLRAITYDALHRTIVFIDDGAGTGSRRIVKIDLNNNLIRAVATLPAFAEDARYSLVYDSNGEYVLIRGKRATPEYTAFRFQLRSTSVTWIGQTTAIGDLLDDAFVAPEGIVAPVSREQAGAHDIIRIVTAANTATPASL